MYFGRYDFGIEAVESLSLLLEQREIHFVECIKTERNRKTNRQMGGGREKKALGEGVRGRHTWTQNSQTQRKKQ